MPANLTGSVPAASQLPSAFRLSIVLLIECQNTLLLLSIVVHLVGRRSAATACSLVAVYYPRCRYRYRYRYR